MFLLDFVFFFFLRRRFLLQLGSLHLDVHISLGGCEFFITQTVLELVLLNHASRIGRNLLLLFGLYYLRPIRLQQFVELYLSL